MAWNEPGNSGDKDKDPWGNQGGRKGGNDGPPDLEDVVKNLQDKVTSIFGGRKGGGGGGDRGRSGGGIGSRSFILIFAVILVVWGLSGIYIVTDGTRGVVLQFGKFNTITEPGPHWFPRFIQSVETVETDKSRSVRVGVNTDESLMLTRDENIVDEHILHMRKLLKTTLEDLDLSVRAYNCLKAAKINSLGEMVKYDTNELLKPIC